MKMHGEFLFKTLKNFIICCIINASYHFRLFCKKKTLINSIWSV